VLGEMLRKTRREVFDEVEPGELVEERENNSRSTGSSNLCETMFGGPSSTASSGQVQDWGDSQPYGNLNFD
jgi:hypothetical protein